MNLRLENEVNVIHTVAHKKKEAVLISKGPEEDGDKFIALKVIGKTNLQVHNRFVSM